MKAKDLLDIVRQLAEKLDLTRRDVELCEACKGRNTQGGHQWLHLDEAILIRDKLPRDLSSLTLQIELPMKLSIDIDKEGHVTTESEIEPK